MATTIDGNFYKKDVCDVLRSVTADLKIQQIKQSLSLRGLILDETQILQALDGLLKSKQIVKKQDQYSQSTYGVVRVP